MFAFCVLYLNSESGGDLGLYCGRADGGFMLMIATTPCSARSRDRSLGEEVTRGGSGWPPCLFQEVHFKSFLAMLSGVFLAGSEFEPLLSFVGRSCAFLLYFWYCSPALERELSSLPVPY